MAEGRLRVPLNQREFAWKQTNVRELFQDAKPIIDDGAGSEYFLGTVVVLRDPEDRDHYRVVVDGQQRLATTAIFLAAVRDYFSNDKDAEGVTAIEQEYLLKMRLPERRMEPQLILNANDHQYFERRVLAKPHDAERKAATRKEHLRPSHKLIHQAASAAAEQVGDIVKNLKPEDRTQALMKWVNFFKNQARVILVTVQDEATAYIVFETMNDRGLELSAIDLIKNRLFALSGDRLEETKTNWTKMRGSLETDRSPTVVKDYVRHFWISKHGRTRAPVLFKAIKEEVTNQKRAIDFAVELETNANQYVALLNPSNALWKEYDSSVAEAVRLLRVFGVSQIRPLLISVMRRISKRSEIKSIFQLTVAWCVRLMAADQLSRGGVLETEYETAALEVHNGNIQTAEALGKQLRNAIPDDKKFKADFATFTVGDGPRAMYLLTALDAFASGNKLIIPNEKLTIEHVLPKNPSNIKDYPDFTSDDYDEYLYRLGNQAVLAEKPNSYIGNEKFAVKREVLSKQPNGLTNEIAHQGDWGKEQINERQAKLAELAVKIWPLHV